MARTRSRGRSRARRAQPDTVLRFYEVVLAVDADTVHEPATVTLSYTDAEAAALDPRSPRAHAEAFKRAVRVERRDHHTPEWREFLCAGVRFRRQRLIGARPAAAA